MPNKDKTGPLGQGSQTGRRMGNCNSNSTDTSKQSFFGRFCGWCFGGGNGWGRNRNRNGRGQGRGFGYGNQQNNNQ